MVFDGDESAGVPEQGGRIYEVLPAAGGRVELRLGRHDIDLAQLHPGQDVWKTDDPELSGRLRRSFEGGPSRLVDLELHVLAEVGRPLAIEAKTATGFHASAVSSTPLEAARSLPATADLFGEQLGRLGGTIYRLSTLSADIRGGPMVAKSLLNQLRRDLVDQLDQAAASPPSWTLPAGPVLPTLLAPIKSERDREIAAQEGSMPHVSLAVLCRRTEQIEAAALLGIRTFYADYQDIKEYAQAVATAGRHGAGIFLATPRIEKPAEANLFNFLAKLGATGILARNAGGIEFCTRRSIPFVADFSLNAANPLSVDLLRNLGAQRVTASYDLNAVQLVDLIESVPSDWLEVVIHQQIPMFHMEHCVYCAFLSPGTDSTNCGRPCDHHDVKLRDRTGALHPLKADVGCRNTLYNAVPQTAAEYLPRLVARGARHLRIEFLDEDASAVRRIVGLYQEALSGHRDARTLWRSSRQAISTASLAAL